MTNDLTIRAATPRDERLLAWMATRLAAFELPPWRTAGDVSDAETRAMMDGIRRGTPEEEVFVAERAGEPVGCLHVLVDTDFFGLRNAHVSVLAVSAAAEGSGVARALMEHAEDWARLRGLGFLTLNVFTGNGRARRFYERGGFAPELIKYVKPL